MSTLEKSDSVFWIGFSIDLLIFLTVSSWLRLEGNMSINRISLNEMPDIFNSYFSGRIVPVDSYSDSVPPKFTRFLFLENEQTWLLSSTV